MINLAICGLGRWGHRLVESVQHLSADVHFTHAVSRQPSRSAEFAASAAVDIVTDYGQVLANPKIDGVVLATPHSQHCAEIVSAARAGKHVFVEKPITLTRADAEEAIRAVRDAGVVLAVGFSRRFAPAYREMIARIATGEVGDL